MLFASRVKVLTVRRVALAFVTIILLLAYDSLSSVTTRRRSQLVECHNSWSATTQTETLGSSSDFCLPRLILWISERIATGAINIAGVTINVSSVAKLSPETIDEDN